MTVFYMESASLKRYRTESGTAVVNQIFAGRQTQTISLLPSCCQSKLRPPLTRAVKGRTIGERARGAILRNFVNDLQSMLVIPISISLANEASEVAREQALRALDAIHLATALRVAVASPDMLVVASDKDLVRAAKSAGLVVLDPEADGAGEQLAKLRISSPGTA